MEEKTMLKVDVPKAIKDLCESIEKCTEHQNRIWQSVLRLIITLSSSLLVVSIALVEKMFTSAIPIFLIVSWILFFNSIIFGIVAEINEVIFFSNFALSQAKKIQQYKRMLSEEKEIPYITGGDTGMIYNSIGWGTIAIDSFIFAVLFMCTSLLGKAIPHVWPIIIIGGAFVIVVNIHLIRKRKTN